MAAASSSENIVSRSSLLEKVLRGVANFASSASDATRLAVALVDTQADCANGRSSVVEQIEADGYASCD